MPVCPQCRREFSTWVEVCPDCEEPLVAQAPQQRARPGDMSLVAVATFPSEPLARMWAEALERQGIGVVVKTGGMTISGVFNGPVDDYRLMVLRSQVRRARRILGIADDPHPSDYDYRL